MTRKPLHKLLLLVIILWSALLVTCSFLWAFMGMMFAGEPAGGGIGAYELMLLAAPFVVTGVLSTVLIKLWQRGHYAWAFIGLLLSSVIIAINFYGYVL
jgi:hypothetical protein